jgi:hypothetical protein
VRSETAATLYRELLKEGRPEMRGISRIGLAVCLDELGMVQRALDQCSAALEVLNDAG